MHGTNRYRFLLKIAFPSSCVAMGLLPNGVFGDMGSDDNTEMSTHAFERLSEHGLAYLTIQDGFSIGRYPPTHVR